MIKTASFDMSIFEDEQLPSSNLESAVAMGLALFVAFALITEQDSHALINWLLDAVSMPNTVMALKDYVVI